jgi:hypothetical protein
MDVMKRFALMIVLFLLASSAFADVGASIFAQGKTRLSVSGGYGEWNSRGYGIVGAGAGYNIIDGLEAGLDGEAWIGNKPHLYSLSPEVRYTFFQMESFKPYVGGFYRRSMYDILKPLDSAGARAGIVTILGERTALSVGLVYESYFHCSSAVYGDCSQTYPEIGLSFVY